MPDEQLPVSVNRVTINPNWRLLEVRIDDSNLLVVRIEGLTQRDVESGNLDMLVSRQSASFLRDSLIRVLMDPVAPALPLPTPPNLSY